MSRDIKPHRLKLLAISDTYCPAEFVEQGLAPLADLGVEIEVRRWEHPTLIDLQEANLAIEQGGPDAIELPAAITNDVAHVDALVVQFTPVGGAFLDAAKKSKGGQRA